MLVYFLRPAFLTLHVIMPPRSSLGLAPIRSTRATLPLRVPFDPLILTFSLALHQSAVPGKRLGFW